MEFLFSTAFQLLLFLEHSEMLDGCRTAESRNEHMGLDLGHHEGSIAAEPQASASAIIR